MVNSQELRKYFALFLRWWWLIVVCAALGAGAAFYYNSRIVPSYTSTATLLVQMGSARDQATSIYAAQRMASTHSQMLTGRVVMAAAVERLGLSWSPNALAGRIRTTQVPDTGLIRLSATHTDPTLTAQIANTVAESYVAYNEQMQQGRYAEYLDSVLQQMNDMAALIEQTTAAIAAMGTPITGEEHAELARLETTLSGYRNTHATLWNSYEQMRLTTTLSTDSVTLFEPAEVPRGPNSTGKGQNILLAAAAGAALAAGVAFLIDYLDDTIKSPDDVREALGLNTLGAIGQRKGDEGELILSEHPRAALSEAYRRLRTNVRFSSLDNPVKTLLVTSPGTTEGKSVTAANLAVAMAQAGLKVVLVDADLRRPRVHRIFGLEKSSGLTQSLLVGRLDGNVRATDKAEGLGILTCGEIPPNPAELLGSQRMVALLADLKAHVDVVIIDSPPLLPVTDAAVLARSVDGVLLVLQAGKTRRSAATQAMESLRQVGANVIGAVLNAVPLRRGGYYYYYYNYYHRDGYGPDGGQPERRKSKRRRGSSRSRGASRSKTSSRLSATTSQLSADRTET